MGNKSSKPDYLVYVHTGDKKGAGTDSNIFIKLHGADNVCSKDTKLTSLFKNSFERGHTDTFSLGSVDDLGSVQCIEVWKDSAGIGPSWFVDLIEVERVSTGDKYCFPINRWINPQIHHVIPQYDMVLPQYDDRKEHRRMELDQKKALYEYRMIIDDFIPQIKTFPHDESFSNDYQWDLVKRIVKMTVKTKVIELVDSEWKHLDDMKRVFSGDLYMPEAVNYWRDDDNFGQQRLSGPNAAMIQLCTQVPENLPVTDEMLQSILEGMTISESIEKKRLFILDYSQLLKDLVVKEGRVFPAPIALFFVNNKKELMPVAIQLYGQPADDNPIFLPTDPPYTWTAAKMWFNMADSNVHQFSSHLGFTHMIMGSVAIATHRCLSQSHPLFRLLAPHFLFLLAINERTMIVLTEPDGPLDKTMQCGVVGAANILRRVWSDWYLNRQGCLPCDLEYRGVDDPEVLPNYHYRDDALLLYRAIEKYVKAIVEGFYKSPEDLENDNELAEWGCTLVSTFDGPEGGCGIKGVPGNGKFETTDQLVETITCFIFTGSVQHAAMNFALYDTGAFQPNYPQFLLGNPPKDKSPLTEDDILKMMLDEERVLLAMGTARVLSEKGTRSLGDFEVQYIYDPIGLQAVEQFREELRRVGEIIDAKNSERKRSYPFIHPREVPNSITI